MNKFAIFRRFSDPVQAVEMAEELGKHEIEYQLIEDAPGVDITFTGNSDFQKEIQLMIGQADFEKADRILDEMADEQLNDVPGDHYLYEFTNEELLEIIAKPDEWNSLDYKLAQKILRDKGQTIDNNYLISLKEQRLIELSRPERDQGDWIIIGYILSLLGGLFGIFIGWYLWTLKKTLPNGEKIYVYSERDRWHGKRIFYLAVILFPIQFLATLLYKFRI